MSIDEYFEMTSSIKTETLSTEDAFHHAWLNSYKDNYTPEQLAFIGGYLSDRLAWLFVSAYQAAIRKTFPINGPGWAAFAVSEDRSEDNPLPGLTENNGLLNGHKTWVAAVNHVEQLIVSSNPDKLWLCHRDMTGLSLDQKTHVSFLADMSQGVAHFENAATESATLLEPINPKVFALREPLYLYIAFTGFLHRHGESDNDILKELLLIADDETDHMTVRQQFADIDNRIASTFQALESGAFNGNYDADKQLMRMYSPSIQRRAQPRPQE